MTNPSGIPDDGKIEVEQTDRQLDGLSSACGSTWRFEDAVSAADARHYEAGAQ